MHRIATKERKNMHNKLISDRLLYSLFNMKVKLHMS